MNTREWLESNPLRKAIGESGVQEAATKLNVSRVTLHSWCTGRYLPRAEAAARIEEAFSVTTSQLLAWLKTRPRRRKQ